MNSHSFTNLDHGIVVASKGRPEENRSESTDPHNGIVIVSQFLLHLGCRQFGEIRMSSGMKSQFMAFLDNGLDQLRIIVDPYIDQEKSSLYIIFFQNIQDGPGQ